MDPDATLDLIDGYVADGDLAEACHSFIDLVEWLSKGGFRPRRMTTRLQQIREMIDELNPDDEDDDEEDEEE